MGRKLNTDSKWQVYMYTYKYMCNACPVVRVHMYSTYMYPVLYVYVYMWCALNVSYMCIVVVV